MPPIVPAIAVSQSDALAQVDVRCPGLPLAVYREVSAHLRQCPGVDISLLPQTAATFDYSQSQVGGLRIHYTPSEAQPDRQQVESILLYYGLRHGPWELIED
ncbi:MAG: hypothetical protein ACFB5Z_06230 [Elainellaceae cyanobacterium]